MIRPYLVQRNDSLPRVFSHNGKMLQDSAESANYFTLYFIDICPL